MMSKLFVVPICVVMVTYAVIIGTKAAEVISGVALVVDGDTIEIGVTKIRLESIDAPETN